MLHAWLTSIGEYPHLVLIVVFAAACAESIAIVGTIVPAGVVMFVAGALIGAGALNGWLALAVAALGAVVGDGLSYELGRRFHAEARSWWQARGREAVWARGEQFVNRHGGKSIVFARFFAPVRAIVPLVVGAAQMTRLRFYPVNIASALAWSPAHIAPGILFGASAALAEAVSARLVAALLLLAALLWLVVLVVRLMTRHGAPLAKRVAQRAVLGMVHRFPRFGARLRRVIEPDAPEFATLAALALLFIGSVWLFGGVLQDVIANDPLMQADTALYTFLQSLRTAPADAVMGGIAALHGRLPGLLMAFAVLVWIVLTRSWRTAAWWVVVVGVAAVLPPAVGSESNGAWPLDWQPGHPHAPLPDGQASFDILVYGFLGWILAHRQTTSWRGGVAIAITLWLMVGGLADLYLGRAWLSGLLGGWALGLAWFAVLAGAHTYWHVFDGVRPKGMALVATGMLAVAGFWAVPQGLRSIDTASVPRPAVSFTVEQWVANGWQQLPARRTEISGDEEEPLPVQWPAKSGIIVQKLRQAGWRPPPAWSVRSALGWLLPQTTGDQLPALPKYSQGETSRIVLVRTDPQEPGTRFVLRLWRSQYVVDSGRGGEPVWYGALYRETLYRPAHLVTLAATHGVASTADIISLLGVKGRAVVHPVTNGARVPDAVLVLPDGSDAGMLPVKF